MPSYKIQEITQVGNLGLKMPRRPIGTGEITDPETQHMLMRMWRTLNHLGGVGLASTQVGYPGRFFLVRIKPTPYRPYIEGINQYVMFNPVITRRSKKEVKDWEGCLSVAHADLFMQVSRAAEITVEYLDEEGDVRTEKKSGLEARVIQHELDHLDGLTILDRVRPEDITLAMSANEYRQMQAEARQAKK